MADDDQTDVFDVDTATAPKQEEANVVEPLYQIYGGSRIAVSQQVGLGWKRKFDATLKTYEQIHTAWDETYRYYNNSQGKSLETPRGLFKRGDSTENVVYSNLNTMLPAIYSKNPEITCTSVDKEDEPFCETLQVLLNTLFKRRDCLHAKPKVKKAAGIGLLTNSGVLRLDFVKKDDSRELVIQQLQETSDKLKKAETQQEVDELYGQLAALEAQMEVYEKSGPNLKNVLAHRLFVDPSAEDPDGLDGNFMIEEIYYLTEALNARFTVKDPEADRDDENPARVLKYKPTHKAVFSQGQGNRDDGLGMVMEALDRTVNIEGFTDSERLAYINSHFTQCYLVWDKITRRVYLFHRDDWKWPIWVWDDPLLLSRFFPYFIIGYGMSTGGTVTVGEVSYYLDQQDEVNDINRQIARIRKTIFDFFFYNTDNVNQSEAEKFSKALKGQSGTGPHMIGVKAGEKKISEMIEALMPPAAQAEPFFNKESILGSINRITNTSDALRGVQFKTNTNQDAVQTYQESARLSIGAKVDVIEDVVADIAYSLAELCVQHYSQEDVAALIGNTHAANWKEMSLEEFRSQYSLEVVAGSMEKPNSVYKKKEAVQVAQAIGQFAQAAPGAALRIMLRVLEKAFTEVVIHKDDWDALDAEIQATLTKGVSTPQGAQQPQQEGAPAPQDDVEQLKQQAAQLPPEEKQKIAAMAQSGVPDQAIVQYIKQAVQTIAPAAQGAFN